MPTSPALDRLMLDVKARLESTGAFGPISIQGPLLVAAAKASAEPAFYRLECDALPADPNGSPSLWVCLVTPSRWLSESIESDLVEHGDDVGELVEDELIELGYEGEGLPPTFQHFRSPDLLYTFRTPIPGTQAALAGGTDADRAKAAAAASVWMQAYEQAFRRLGDMEEKVDD